MVRDGERQIERENAVIPLVTLESLFCQLVPESVKVHATYTRPKDLNVWEDYLALDFEFPAPETPVGFRIQSVHFWMEYNPDVPRAMRDTRVNWWTILLGPGLVHGTLAWNDPDAVDLQFKNWQRRMT